MSQNESAGHKYVSVPVCFSVKWKRAEDPELLRAEVTSHRTSDRYMAPPPAFTESVMDAADVTEFQRTSPHIFKMWGALERKLDFLIRLMSRELADDPALNPGLCVMLSEGGASVKLKEAPAKGELLRMRLFPPSYPVVMIETVAEVLSAESDPEKSGEWIVEVDFSAIHHSDREEIVQFLFRRQREILQKKRE